MSRMISGGSAGLRTMIALPRLGAADLLDGRGGGLGELVDVGAGARPGRLARRSRRRSRRSATGVTPATAATIGIVAWPPQVTMLTFGASRCSSRLTAGTTYGPIAAGREVDQPLAVRAQDARRWRRAPSAEVASKTISISSKSGMREQARRRRRRWSARRAAGRAPGRRSRGRCRPSRPSPGARDSRRTLIIRSVPMLPEPMIATLALLMRSRPSVVTNGHDDRAEPGDRRLTTSCRRRPAPSGRGRRTGRPRRRAAARRARAPCGPATAPRRAGRRGRPRRCRSRRPPPSTVIDISTSTGSSSSRVRRWRAEHEDAGRGVVGDGVGEA